MSARRIAANHTLPANPTWIEFPRSDGNRGQWPTNTVRVVDQEAQVNYMRPVPEDESLSILWRIQVGKELAKKMNLHEGPSYVLRSFPDGYHMFDHNKGLATSPRHDPYLFGSVNVGRFRSTNEFIPHALWLMQDATLNRANCECKYCAKKPQRLISDSLGLTGKRSTPRLSSPSASHPMREPRAPRQARTKPFTAVRRAPKPVRQLTGPTQSMLPERDNDVRAAHTGNELRQKRYFRKGELLWCALYPPIAGRTGEADSITFWPGLVEDVNVKAEPIMLDGNPPHPGDLDMSALYEPDDDATESRPSTYSAPEFQPPHAPVEGVVKPSWTVRHWNVYTMKLLAVTHKYHVSDDQVLPYLAYAPSEDLVHAVQDELLQVMDEIPAQEMESDLENVFSYNPCLPVLGGTSTSQEARFREAVAPYSLAIQIASHISRYWMPTDDWECKFTIPIILPPAPPPPPSAPAAPPPPPAEGSSLASLITQSMANNATSDLYARVSAQSGNPGAPGMSAEQLEAHTTRMVGTMAGVQAVTQQRYQGLWWGAERIWTDELVRLKLARCQFAPSGSDIIYPPAGPSASSMEHHTVHGGDTPVDPQRLGASEKGLFFRIEGLFVVDVPNADGSGTAKECRASGVIYELADVDWEADVTTNDKGKGKERATDVGGPQPPFTDTFPQAPEPGPSADVSGASLGLAGPSFMHGPSPLKPPPLPNPDPAVPVDATAANTLSQTLPGEKPKKRTLHGQLSHPVLSTPYPLPPAPEGFKFRPILHAGHEVVISLSLISGRYYPHLLSHPLMVPMVQRALALTPEEGGLYENKHLWAIDGLISGVYLSMDPSVWQPSRQHMNAAADKVARMNFRATWEERKQAREQPPDEAQGAQVEQSGSRVEDAMDVDVQ